MKVGVVVQRLEHRPVTAEVAGSNPVNLVLFYLCFEKLIFLCDNTRFCKPLYILTKYKPKLSAIKYSIFSL